MLSPQVKEAKLQRYQNDGFLLGVAADSPGTKYPEDIISYNPETKELAVGTKVPFSSRDNKYPLQLYLGRRGFSLHELTKETRQAGLEKILFWNALTVVLKRIDGQVIPTKIGIAPVCVADCILTNDAKNISNRASHKYPSAQHPRMYTTIINAKGIAESLFGDMKSMRTFDSVTEAILCAHSLTLAYANGTSHVNSRIKKPHPKRSSELKNILNNLDSFELTEIPPLNPPLNSLIKTYEGQTQADANRSSSIKAAEMERLINGLQTNGESTLGEQIKIIKKEIAHMATRHLNCNTHLISNSQKNRNKHILTWLEDKPEHTNIMIDAINQNEDIVELSIIKYTNLEERPFSCRMKVGQREYLLPTWARTHDIEEIRKSFIECFFRGQLVRQNS